MLTIENKLLNIKFAGLLPIYEHSKKLEKTNLKEYKNYHKLLKENNPPEVYLQYLKFETQMKEKKTKNPEYDLFLCEL